MLSKKYSLSFIVITLTSFYDGTAEMILLRPEDMHACLNHQRTMRDYIACILSTTCVNHKHKPHWQFLVFTILSYFLAALEQYYFSVLYFLSHI